MAQMYPLGVRTDGSYYTRIEWASHTESDPMLWVLNAIDDDTETHRRHSWGANTFGPANVVLSFFGEEQTVSKIRIFRNVGITASVPGKSWRGRSICFHVSDTDEPRSLRTKEDKIDDVPWTLVKEVPIEKAEGWVDVTLDKPVAARYVRFELVGNRSDVIDWTEISELKIFP